MAPRPQVRKKAVEKPFLKLAALRQRQFGRTPPVVTPRRPHTEFLAFTRRRPPWLVKNKI